MRNETKNPAEVATNTYTLTVTDNNGQPLPQVTIAFYDGSGKPILVDGQPTSLVLTSPQDEESIQSVQASLQLKFSAAGFADQLLTVNPGATTVKMQPAGSAAAVVQTVKNGIMNNPIVILLILVVLLAVAYMIYKKFFAAKTEAATPAAT